MILQCLSQQAVNKLPVFNPPPPSPPLKEIKSKTVRVDERRNQARKDRSTLTEETQDASWLLLWHRMNESPGKLYLLHSADCRAGGNRTSRRKQVLCLMGSR